MGSIGERKGAWAVAVVRSAPPKCDMRTCFRKYKYSQIHRKSSMKLEETLKSRREEILATAAKYGVRNVRRLSVPSPAARPTMRGTSTSWWSL
jgi:hypothetical protein